MSLLVWLPLTGHLNNQGLNDIPIVNNDATVDDNGKIGKCYSFDGSSSRISDTVARDYSYPLSVAAWIKPTDAAGDRGQYIISIDTDAGGTSGHIIALGLYTSNNLYMVAGGVRHEYQPLTNDTWYHITGTITEDKIYSLYVNGVLVETGTCGNAPASKWLTIGARSNSSTGGAGGAALFFQGYMNDVRIYNHALSAKEVKELSKGLVLHYPLTGGGRSNTNLLKNSNFLQSADGLEGYSVNGTSATKQTDCMQVISSSNKAGIYNSHYDEITTGTITTFSAYIKADATMTIYIGVDGSGITNCQAYTIGTDWQRISITKAKTTNNSIPRIYGNGTFYLKWLKYELGGVPTPWMPNSVDTAYTAMGYDSTIEYDVSGYNYHGTKADTITYSSDSARYAVCSNFNGTDSYIEAEPLPAETKTISVWLKTTWDKPTGGSDVYRLALIDSTNKIAIGFSSNAYGLYVYTSDSSSDRGTAVDTTNLYQANKWNHIVVIKTGDKTRTVYINGQLAPALADSRWGSDMNKLLIGCRHNSGAYSAYFDGQISDVRAYVTALTEADVKELYNTAASLANNGTLFAYEYVEA